ncbi:MAG TPA: MFS transporter [Amycolatopsis sp.]|nr:MFS transporter [Amycolatopsis sp.]
MRINEDAHPTKMGRLATAAVLATMMEYFDFLIYSTAAALVFGKLFFPGLDGVTGTLASFATFAVGFVARPLGGIAAGHVGDRYGRKPPLIGAMLVMGLGTFVIGVLPGYDQIGIWAPMLLVVVRLVQGFGVGAQWGGAALLLTEHAPVARRGFYGSLIQTGAVFGAVAGNAVFLLISGLLTDAQFSSWGWRLPFFMGLVIVGLGIYLQLAIEDTPVFRRMRETSARTGVRRAPLSDAVRHHWRQILQAAGALFLVNATFYILISGMLDYGTRYAGLTKTGTLVCVLVAGATEAVSIPFFGALSDRVGRRKLFLIGSVLTALFIYPMFLLVNTGSVAVALPALIVAFTIHATMYGPGAALYAEMFPADVRYSGASLGFQIASVVAGGFAPFIMTALLAITGSAWSVSLYVIGMAAITFAAVFTIRESFRRDLHRTTEQESTAMVGQAGDKVT